MKLTKSQIRFQIRMAMAGISESLTLDAHDKKVTKADLTTSLVLIRQAGGVLTNAINRPKKQKQ